MTDSLHGLVDHLFRHSSGQMVATLTRILGSDHLALAEEVVQDALVKAMQQWTLRGVPDDPVAWLFQIARNGALDHLRRQASLRQKEADLIAAFTARPAEDDGGFAHELRDDQLRMMLMCCHPAIPGKSRIALTLKTVGGFSVDEIARAFLASRETIAQRIVRAKRLIRDERIAFEMPSRDELPVRLESLLQVLYLMFNEGYSAHTGDDLVRADLCREAIRLAAIVADHAVAGGPAVHALLALMLLQAARLPARTDAAGELVILAEQDRSRWDTAMMAEGLRRLDRAGVGEELTPYHLEAAIAASHASENVDWSQVIELYDALLAIRPSPVVALNRAVALAMTGGPASGIAAIESIEGLGDYLPRSLTLGQLWLRAGDAGRAARHFRHALTLPGTTPAKRFLMRKLGECT
ncbi:MAG TPA: sigma-70 family RNA polymerase sigma factor [Thermoanaerobaculia bacterium]|nr:sigma-70 family RNA polymerase sigma factor [Thermoanaerobaculia bacterium]